MVELYTFLRAQKTKKCNNRKYYQKIILLMIMRLFGAFVSQEISDQFSILVEISLVSVEPGGGVLGLRTYGEVPLENLKSYRVPESNS